MKFSIPFLAWKLDQLPHPGKYPNTGVEAVIFNREDLEQSKWEKVWQGVDQAVRAYLPQNVTFHFPVNHSDYVTDFFVRNRLYEALQRASELRLNGVVVHANRIHPIATWKNLDLILERQKVIDVLAEIRARCCSPTWLALENMPVMDNNGFEVDPLFVYPEDFSVLRQTEVKVIFDICHFSNTQANAQAVFSGQQKREYYPNLRKVDPFDFLSIQDQIVHWHFSAFTGVANPDTKQTCREGMIPTKSYFGEDYYRAVFYKILEVSSPSACIVFEIQEENYQNRQETMEMFKWVQSLLPYPLATALPVS